MGVEKPVKPLRAWGKQREIALESLREAIEEAPKSSGLKGLVRRVSPLLEDIGHLGDGANATVDRSHDEVMNFGVIERMVLVFTHTVFQRMPFPEQANDRCFRQTGQIPVNESGVLPGQFDFSGETQVIADEDLGSRNETGGEAFVMGVSQTENPRVIVMGATVLNLNQTKVAQTIVGEAVRFIEDLQPVPCEGSFN